MSGITKRDMEIASMIHRSVEITHWAINYLEDNLPDLEGCSLYGCDFASEITEAPNVNGAYIIGRHASLDFIAAHIFDAEYEYDAQCQEYGKPLHEPFENPEAFIVVWLIDIVEEISSNIPLIEVNWDNEWEMTEEDIREILAFLGRGDTASEQNNIKQEES